MTGRFLRTAAWAGDQPFRIAFPRTFEAGHSCRVLRSHCRAAICMEAGRKWTGRHRPAREAGRNRMAARGLCQRGWQESGQRSQQDSARECQRSEPVRQRREMTGRPARPRSATPGGRRQRNYAGFC
jgi:hypothetical protein